ncbi:TOBE domain-containing protein [Desulfogranum mediterraneum]|uniref:TOBE domain-containing protein n=1 Tax=Desulfogranum mediterraneum TaxID=160661 RepID=UPI0005592DDB|nr:TOBE domain-containing protein [Desulfogranum mediterraneum]
MTQAVSSAALLCQLSDGSNREDPIISLLEAIGASGSINQAAKSVGLSYKAAWERLETINNLSPSPLISRQTGGSGGGGTLLTRDGRDFLARASLFRQQLKQLVSFFHDSPEEAYAMLTTLRGMEMKISARNVWLGNVTAIEKGVVNSVVTVGLKGRDTIVATITDNSVKRLGLEPGKAVHAIVKAPSVLLSLEVDPGKISARNILRGTINRIIGGAVNDEVIIDIAGGNTVTSILTSESVRRLGLGQGLEVAAVIKASSVLLALP